MRFEWSREGGYEVSSKGDIRFSAFRAIMTDGRSIEHHYQCDVKGWDPGGTAWQLGKGRPPKDQSMTPARLKEAYLALWRDWAARHPNHIADLRKLVEHHETAFVLGDVCYLTDSFAKTAVNQAWALAEILNEYEQR